MIRRHAKLTTLELQAVQARQSYYLAPGPSPASQRLECLAARGVIEAGSNVRVVAVAGMEIKVEPV